jgi:hypothetical protein
MLKTLFWNIHGRPLLTEVGELVREHAVDVVVLAECDEPPQKIQDAVQSVAGGEFFVPDATPSRVMVVSRMGGGQFREVDQYMGGLMSIRHTTFRDAEFLWAFVHLSSKREETDDDQADYAKQISDRLREIEARRNHRRTIVCGDFNMNPFERGLVAAGAFHGMMTRDVVKRGTRKVKTLEYPFFYNPMWGLFGDRTPGPPGTYYSRRASSLSYDWNMFDQVLLRKDVLPFFDDDLRVLESVGNRRLVTKRGHPDKRKFSDHLPLLFSLRLN